MAENEKPLISEIQALIKATEDSLALKSKEQMEGLMLQVETLNQKVQTSASKTDLDQFKKLQDAINEVNSNMAKNQEVIDNFVKEEGQRKVQKKNFGESFSDMIAIELESKKDEFKNFQTDRRAKISLDLKVGNMLIANVSGDAVQGYNDRQGLVPSQNPNLRDLIPTTISPTGSFVTYRETGTSGSISAQTEGSAKTQIDYSFTEVKTVSKYIAGWSKFSKQLMYALPFLQSTLPRMLLRDFYKKENAYFYNALMVAAAGNNTGSATVDAEEIIEMIANQRNANFNASNIIVDWAEWGRLLATKPGSTVTNYSVPGGIVIDPAGNVRIAGVPIIGASWANNDALLLFDRDYVERVETESLRVEFSYEDDKNFEYNLVTARVECFEEINILRPDAIIKKDLGNASS